MWVPLSVIVVAAVVFLAPMLAPIGLYALHVCLHGIGLVIGAEKPRAWWSFALVTATQIALAVGFIMLVDTLGCLRR